MPEPLLHFSISFALTAPILGVRRAVIVSLIALLPDLDVLVHVHRSATHSIILLSAVILIAVIASYKLGKDFKTVIASSLSLLSHPILDLFQTHTPILYPLLSESYHISLQGIITISEEIKPQFHFQIKTTPVDFNPFTALDAPLFTDTGFIISLMLIMIPLLHSTVTQLKGRTVNEEFEVSASSHELRSQSFLDPEQGLSAPIENVTILIPTLNEEKAIGKVIEEVRKSGYEDILIVDGYSTDKTVDIAKSCGAKVIYQVGVGKASAIRTGIQNIKTEYVVVMDGDGTYDPRDVEKLLRTAVEYDYDEVIGYRVDRKNIPLLHRFGNRVISSIISLLLGRRIRDPCSGMYLLKTSFARNLEITGTGFDVEVEIVVQAVSLGKVGEVPIRYRERIGRGKLESFRDGMRILLTAVKIVWLYNSVLLFSSIGSFLGIIGLGIIFWQLALRYIHGAEAWSWGWAWLGLTLLVLGLQAFTIAIISLLLKRMERRIIQLSKK
mgnify:FL=1